MNFHIGECVPTVVECSGNTTTYCISLGNS